MCKASITRGSGSDGWKERTSKKRCQFPRPQRKTTQAGRQDKHTDSLTSPTSLSSFLFCTLCMLLYTLLGGRALPDRTFPYFRATNPSIDVFKLRKIRRLSLKNWGMFRQIGWDATLLASEVRKRKTLPATRLACSLLTYTNRRKEGSNVLLRLRLCCFPSSSSKLMTKTNKVSSGSNSRLILHAWEGWLYLTKESYNSIISTLHTTTKG